MIVVITTVLLTFLVILLVIAAMSIGVLNGRRAISGSCGGIAGGNCELCRGSCPDKARSQGDHE